MSSSQNTPNLTIRPATGNDLMAVFHLANEEGVRANSFHSEKIELENHKKWFAKKIVNPHSLFLIAEIEGQFAGQVRFDIEDNVALIGISLEPKMRGRGVATNLLKGGIEYFKNRFPQVKIFHAYIKPVNESSIRLFERADFTFSQKTKENGCDALLYQYAL